MKYRIVGVGTADGYYRVRGDYLGQEVEAESPKDSNWYPGYKAADLMFADGKKRFFAAVKLEPVEEYVESEWEQE